MRILLTGGLGFIGSAVVRRLIATTEHVVVNIDKETYAASHDALAEARAHNRHVHVKADICDHAAMTSNACAARPVARFWMICACARPPVCGWPASLAMRM